MRVCRWQAAPASLNHYSKGAVCDWLFRVMCGIRVDGENHFTIAPCPAGHFTHAEAEYLSIYGPVASCREKTADGITYTVNVSANCTATLTLPGHSAQELTAGSSTF